MGLWDLITGSNPSVAVGEAANAAVGGIFDGIKGLIEEFHLPPEQKVKFELLLQQAQLSLFQARVADAQSARSMQMQTKSMVPAILTILNTIGFFSVCAYLIKYGMPTLAESGTEALLLLIGALVSGYGLCLQFWLGSSSGSQAKDWMIYKSNPSNGK